MYNLRSNKQNTVHLPIEIQLAGDTQFIDSVLHTNSHNSDFSENMSDSDTSASDLNCSDLMQNSFDGVSDGKNCASGSSTSKSDKDLSVKSSDSDQQAVINAQILEQLHRIGKRLDHIEQKDCKKTSDKTKIKNVKIKGKKVKQTSDVTEQRQSLPVPHNLWQSSVSDEALLQLRVDQRLQELTDLAKTGTNSKIKSQRGGNFEVLVKQRVKWPHEYVLSGLNKERVTYDQLNVTQWVAGFGRTMRDESDPIMKQHMLEYLIALMDDANDFSWTSAKASHAVLLCRMEQGEIKDFSDIASIDRIRRANAQKHVSASVAATHASMNKRQSKVTRSMPCTYFNQGTCMQQKTHETRGVLYKHICAVCFANTGRTFSHAETECKNKNKQMSKNE